MGITYFVGKTAIGAYFNLIYRTKVTGQENIPEKGAAILCCNHISYIDPMMLACRIKRPVSFMGKKELFKNRFFGFVLKRLSVIPVDRTANDIAAYKKTLSVLKKGKIIGIFAQGTRMEELDVKSAKSGVALFAIKSGAPVIPVCITSSYEKFKPVNIKIGKPVDLSEYKNEIKRVKSETLDNITEKIMVEVSKLEDII